MCALQVDAWHAVNVTSFDAPIVMVRSNRYADRFGSHAKFELSEEERAGLVCTTRGGSSATAGAVVAHRPRDFWRDFNASGGLIALHPDDTPTAGPGGYGFSYTYRQL